MPPFSNTYSTAICLSQCDKVSSELGGHSSRSIVNIVKTQSSLIAMFLLSSPPSMTDCIPYSLVHYYPPSCIISSLNCFFAASFSIYLLLIKQTYPFQSPSLSFLFDLYTWSVSSYYTCMSNGGDCTHVLCSHTFCSN